LAVKLPTEVCAQVGVKRGTPGQLLEVSAVGSRAECVSPRPKAQNSASA
jgi:hypothetical protein